MWQPRGSREALSSIETATPLSFTEIVAPVHLEDVPVADPPRLYPLA
jgi:hypothetical protein